MCEGFLVTVNELIAQFDFPITPRTIEYYVAEGIIPPPTGKTRAARYDHRHIEGIKAYRALQHSNVFGRHAVEFCREEGISLPEFVKQREDSLKTNGIGIG